MKADSPEATVPKATVTAIDAKPTSDIEPTISKDQNDQNDQNDQKD